MMKKDNDANKFQNPLIAQSNEVSETILRAIEEAINDGGHGYAFPLNTTIHIGSKYGRHRSVIVCEQIAQILCKLFRSNKDHQIKSPVSVSTRHWDVDNNHKDGEAFGNDLRKEHEMEVRWKKK